MYQWHNPNSRNCGSICFCMYLVCSHFLLGNPLTSLYNALAGSPHVKSNVITGSIKSIWRAITSPAFDFQGDPAQQGGALIVGPGM